MSQSAIDFRKLSVDERIQLVEDIWDSIAAESPDAVELTPAQRAEIQRRLNAHDADPTAVVAWEQVRAELFKREYKTSFRRRPESSCLLSSGVD